jgi:hypothetical protein
VPSSLPKNEAVQMSKTILIYPSQLYAPNWGEHNIIKAHMINLYSFLKKNKINVSLIDLENEIGRPKSEEEVRRFMWKFHKMISGFDFDFIGISCWSSINYLSSVMVADICKSVNKKCIISVGGYHPTAQPFDFTYKDSPFDFIIRGEGEISLKNICDNIEKREDYPKIIDGKHLNMQQDIFLNWEGYSENKPMKEVPIYLSRGCPFSCSFCMEASKDHSRWRSFPVAAAIQNIREIVNIFDPRQISFTDACFGYNRLWRKEFLGNLKKEKIDKKFWMETRVDALDKSDIDIISGLRFEIQLGIESGSEEMLRIMNKSNNPKKYLKRCKEIISYLNIKEVPYKILLLFNHPGETDETYKDTLRFLDSLIRDQKVISGILGAQTFSFFPGSKVSLYLKEYYQRFGTIIHHKEWWKQKSDHYILSTSIVPGEELMNMYSNLNYFQQDIARLNQQMFEKMTGNLKSFWLSGEA